MIHKKIIAEVEFYLSQNYVEPEPLPEGMKFSTGTTPTERKPDKYDGFTGAIRWQLDKIFDQLELQGTFGQLIRDLIKLKGMTEVEVYKKAQLDRRIFSKIRRYRNYVPSERTIWAILLALELNIEDATKILEAAGYTFSKYSKEDLIIKFCFENEIYDLFVVNEILYHYGFKPLGDSIL